MDNAAKEILLEFLGYLRYKIENDKITMEDMESLSRMFMNNLDLSGTAEDFANFYGKPVDSVRHVLSRRVIDKPSRRVLHSFSKFRKAVPASWRK